MEAKSDFSEYGNKIKKPTANDYIRGSLQLILGGLITALTVLGSLDYLKNSDETGAEIGYKYWIVPIIILVGAFFIYLGIYNITNKKHRKLVKTLYSSFDIRRDIAARHLKAEFKKGNWKPLNDKDKLAYLTVAEEWKELLLLGNTGIDYIAKSIRNHNIQYNRISDYLIIYYHETKNQYLIKKLIYLLSKDDQNKINSEVMETLKKITGECYSKIKDWKGYLETMK